MSQSDDRSLRVFVSYARNDDIDPVDKGSGGFVTTLLKYLDYHLKSLGPPLPEIWRDKKAIEPSAQFDPAIAVGLDDADVLLVVLSNNWIHRPYCLQELELFGRRWSPEDNITTRRRIVVVAKQPLDPLDRPELLRGQEGYAFYHPSDADPGKYIELFGRTRLSEDFHDAARAVAVDLWNRARLQSSSDRAAVGVMRPGEAKPSPHPRTIYLARPAADVRQPYLRLVEELRQRGYRTVPDSDIPIDGSATALIEAYLGEAECSIHLLGEKLGFTPEDASMPIVQLQLHLAGKRAGSADDRTVSAFHRIIWAPKFIDVDTDTARGNAGRDPQSVLNKFDRELVSDKIDGGEVGSFVEFVLQHLEETSTRSGASLGLTEPNARVYVCHSAEDLPYAIELGAALQKRNVEPMMPALEGDAAEIAALHRRELAECDAVILCWANAPDVWLRSHSHELRSWRTLGREREFAYRSVVAGPPPRQTKNLLLLVPPQSEVDVVLDLTAVETVTPETLDPLFPTEATS